MMLDIRCVMRDAIDMRTTLDIDEDVLSAAKDVAADRGTTAGKVLSEWGRQALEPRERAFSGEIRNGVPVIKGGPGALKITPEMVQAIEDEMDEEYFLRKMGPGVRNMGEV
jgi:hypothetical protein